MLQIMKTVIYRILLILLLALSASIAFRRDLNLAAYTPNQLMRDLGFSYHAILSYEHHFHLVLHISVGFLLTLLISGSRLFSVSSTRKRVVISAILVVAMAIVAEIIQAAIGRNVEIADVVYGLIGILIAAVTMLVRRSE